MPKRKIKIRLRRFDVWQKWEYKHTTGLIIFLFVFILLLDTTLMTTIFNTFVDLGLIGIFLAGILFVSLFTATPAVFILLNFSDYNPLIIALIAGLGSMVGDYLILKLFKDKIAYELKPIAFKFGIPQAITYLQGKRSTLGLVRLIGSIVIASPLPDEIGIALLGICKLSRLKFLVICYILNAAGIYLLVVSARAIG